MISVIKNENIRPRRAHTEVCFYRDEDGRVPLIRWLDALPKRVQLKCTEKISRLAELGHELRRPEADYLRDGIYELRASYQGVHYRVLYFFAGKAIVVLLHGVTKEDQVPYREIDRAIKRKEQVQRDFRRYAFRPGQVGSGE